MSGNNENENYYLELTGARARVLFTILARLKYLHLTAEPPPSFFIGQRYVDDEREVRVQICATFAFPAYIDNQQFWVRGCKVIIRQYPPVLVICVERTIPESLWDDLRLIGIGQQFALAYFGAMMPTINRKLLENRYTAGHLLSRTFSLFEALEITVASERWKISLDWPVAVPPFPKSKALAPKRDELYLRDFIDSMHSYFRGDYDDCIRRVVTAAENFYAQRKWKGAKSRSWVGYVIGAIDSRVKAGSFRQILQANVETETLGGQVVVENLKQVYAIRNKIVHRGFRMGADSGIFCDKAISTLRYLIQRYSGDREISQYAFSLGMQFGLFKDLALTGMFNLDEIRRRVGQPHKDEAPISNMMDMDQFVFSALRISGKDLNSIR